MITFLKYPDDRKKLERLLAGRLVQLKDLESSVSKILDDVKREGDKAVFRYTMKFDGIRMNRKTLRVSPREMEEGRSRISGELSDVLREAAANIRTFHEKQKVVSFEYRAGMGAVLGMRCLPMKRAGVYVPGGQAAYPSTLLMNVIPAQVAGVDEIYVVTPPGKDGGVPDALLAAASLLNISAIFKVGGVQAIGALVFGAASIPAVDVIVGPGNKYVAAAKKAVMGQVAIDSIAGPSEVVILADDSARPEFVAADMLAQAEHDADAMSCLVTPSGALAARAVHFLKKFAHESPRKTIIAKSLKSFGRIILTETIEEAVDAVNLIAPEHLEIITENPRTTLAGIRNAGAIFLGNYSPVAVGDYFAGPNHVLPTAGSSRFSSPLGVQNFMKYSSIIEYSERKMHAAAPSVALFAEAEGLHAHALSVNIRKKSVKS